MIEVNSYDQDGGLKDKTLYKYDKKGNTIGLISYYSSDKSYEFRYEYEYDNKGNWINLLRFRNNIPNDIIEREIEYF